MLFKTPTIGTQWASIHPSVRAVVGELATALDVWKLHPLTITDAIRTQEQQEILYWRSYLKDGVAALAARDKARRQFSWHMASCAVDFRGSKQWRNSEERRIMAWLRKRCPAPQWECLLHEVGHGLHFHIACKDFAWRRQWEQSTGAA